MSEERSATRSGLERTLDTLKNSANHAAGRLLAEFLFHAPEAMQDAIAEVIFDCRPREAFPLIVERFHELPTDRQSQFLKLGSDLSLAIRQAYVSEDQSHYNNALNLIERIPAYDQISLVLGCLEHASFRRSDATRIIDHLAHKLNEESAAPREQRTVADVDLVRRQFLGPLEVAFKRFSHHRLPVVPQSILLIADESSSLVREALTNPSHSCHDALVDCLRTRTTPEVSRWILHYLREGTPPVAVLRIVSTRDDVWFIRQLLHRIEWISEPNMALSLKAVRELCWAEDLRVLFTELNAEEQASAVIFALQCGMSNTRKLHLLSKVIERGSREARRVAACALQQFPGAEATHLMRQCLDDSDADVQLAATQMIRSKNLPDAISLLLHGLEHHESRIRAAAKQALGDFSFERYAQSFDRLDERSRNAVGNLAFKVDDTADEKLRQMLLADHRAVRLRALHIVKSLQLNSLYWREIRELLAESDQVVRRTAAAVLAEIDDSSVVEWLVDEASRPGNRRKGAQETLEAMARTIPYSH